MRVFCRLLDEGRRVKHGLEELCVVGWWVEMIKNVNGHVGEG